MKDSSICSTDFCKSAVLWAMFPSVKKQLWKIRRFSRVANIKIFFPLFMRKANAERIPNRFFFNLRTKPPRVYPSGALLCCNREMKVLLFA